MKKKKKRIRLRWGRIAAALSVLAAIVVAIYFLISGAIALFSKLFAAPEDGSEESETAVNITMEMLKSDSIIAHRIDSIIRRPQYLDTSKIAISVYNLATQQTIYSRHDNDTLIPASCMKIATALTALERLGMNYRYKEHLLVRGEMKRDTLVGNLLLLADDDPLFESFDGLITKMKQRGIRHVRGNVIVTLAREDTLRAHPTAKAWDIPYHKTPILLRGKKYVERHFLASLRAKGVTIKKDNSVNSLLAKGRMGGGKYHYVATSSHALRDVITPMLIHSSNIKADALFYHLNYKAGLYPNRRMNWDNPNVITEYLKMIPSDDKDIMQKIVVHDGSGLSPENRLTARFLVDILRHAYKDKAVRDYLINEALASPAGGERCGSLMTRMCRPEYKGRLFCKTGTMTTVGASSLSGYIIGQNGNMYVFSIINSDSPVYESRRFQDYVCKAMMK